MQLILVSALLFALLVAIFAISNANEVIIRFHFPGSCHPGIRCGRFGGSIDAGDIFTG